MEVRDKRSKKSIARTVVVLILAFVLALGFSIVFDKVWPQEAHAACITESGDNCVRSYPREFSRAFRQHELRNSRSVEFPRHVKRKIRRYMSNHRVPTDGGGCSGVGCWYSDPLRASRCYTFNYFFSRTRMKRELECVKQNNAFYRTALRETTRVSLKCGGAAVVGLFVAEAGDPGISRARKGWWGVAAGGSACLYSELFEKWW